MELTLSLVPEMSLRLALHGGISDGCLTETARALRASPGVSAMLRGVAEVDYRSACDMVLGLCSGAWLARIVAFYDDDGPGMTESTSADAIEAVDAILAAVVEGVAELAPEWRSGAYHDRALRDALRTFAEHHLTAHATA